MRLAFIVSKTLEPWAASFFWGAVVNLGVSAFEIRSQFVSLCEMMEQQRWDNSERRKMVMFDENDGFIRFLHDIYDSIGSSSVKDWTLTIVELQEWQAVRYQYM